MKRYDPDPTWKKVEAAPAQDHRREIDLPAVPGARPYCPAGSSPETFFFFSTASRDSTPTSRYAGAPPTA